MDLAQGDGGRRAAGAVPAPAGNLPIADNRTTPSRNREHVGRMEQRWPQNTTPSRAVADQLFSEASSWNSPVRSSNSSLIAHE